MRYIFFFILLVLVFQRGLSQAVMMQWKEKPQPKHHFYGIDTGDSASIKYIGIATCVAANKPSSASLIVYKNNLPIDTVITPLSFNGDTSSVNIVTKIKGQLAVYKTVFKIGSSTFISDTIKAGMVILCGGQSNMVASYPQTNILTSIPLDPYIASFGNSDYDPIGASFPTGMFFNLATPNSAYTYGSVGLVAFYVAKTLKDSLHLPICVINGACGGSKIVEHLKSQANFQDSTTIYGRLLRRVKKAHIEEDQIKGFFWFQGEADVMTPTSDYLQDFTTLTDSLATDYGTSLPIFLAQIRRQCCNSLLDTMMNLQELQRHLPHVKGVISTNGIEPGADNCHLKIHSYIKLGKQMARLLLAYKEGIPPSKFFPEPIIAQMCSDSTTLKLVLSTQIDSSQLSLCDSLFRITEEVNNNVYPISYLSVIEDTLLLHVNSPIINPNHLFVSYLGSPLQDSTGVLSKGGLALLSFKNMVVEPAPPIISFNNTPYKKLVVCVDTIVTISTSAANVYEYFWYKNGVLLNNVSGSSFQDTILTGQNTYSLQVTYTQGGNISASSNELLLINPEPIAVIAPNGPTTSCISLPTSLTALSFNTSNIYTWRRYNTVLQSDTIATFTPTLSGNYNLTVTDTNQCSTISDWISMVVNPLPSAVAGTDKTICDGKSVVIGSNTQANLTYQWIPNSHMSNAFIANPEIEPHQDISYALVVTDLLTHCINTDTINITVIPTPPNPTLESTNSPVCEGANIILSPKTLGATTVNWYENNSFLLNQSIDSTLEISHTSSSENFYFVEAVGANGCISDTSNTVSAWIKEAPIPILVSTPPAINNVIEICVLDGRNGEVNFTAIAPIAAYAWKMDGIYIPNENTQELRISMPPLTHPKTILVQASYPNGCVKYSAPQLLSIITSGCIDTMDNSQQITLETPDIDIYPNPTQDILHIDIMGIEGTVGDIIIYNFLGQKVIYKEVHLKNHKAKEELNLSSLESGVYIMVFQINGQKYRKKFVKE